MISFTKMQGLGNDYVYINNDIEEIKDMSKFSIDVSNRNFGIGSDGVIYIFTLDKDNYMSKYCNENADVYFRIFNPDGSEADMCGNGIRCVAKYVYEKGIVKKKMMKIGTKSEIKEVELFVDESNLVNSVKVNMGASCFNTDNLKINYEGRYVINTEFDILDRKLNLTCLSIGNMHTVVFVDDVDNFDVEKYGKYIENMDIFSDRTNVEFVEIKNEQVIKIRVWERGVGETLACGTGATASSIAGYVTHKTKEKCTVLLKGGKLQIEYDEYSNIAYMTGDAKFVYEGMLYC